MDQHLEDSDLSILFDFNLDVNLILDETPPDPGWMSSRGGVVDTASDNPWHFGAAYAIDKTFYIPSGPQQSTGIPIRPWSGEILGLPGLDGPLDSSLPFASLDANDVDGYNSGNADSGRQSAALTPPSPHEDYIPTNNKRSKDPSSRKRPFDDLVTCFPSNQDTKGGRTKAPYTLPRRKEVAFHRDVGSCSRCRSRGVKFTFPRPCQNCIKAAGSSQLARWICVRESFHELRFGSFDLLFESFTQKFLESEIQTYRGQKREVHFTFLFDTKSLSSFALPVAIRDYSNQDPDATGAYHTMAVDNNRFEIIPSDRYALIPGSVPSLDDLLSCVQVDTGSVCKDPVERLITSLQVFMSQYSEDKCQLPLKDLLASSVKILKLLRCWRSKKMVLMGANESYSVRASRAMSSQILQVIKEGIRNEEMFILKYLEKLMYGAKGPGKDNMIALWACLWSLILTYRDSMSVYKQYSLAPRPSSKQPNCSDHEMGAGASKRMYEMLTANYSVLFRTSTPLYSGWTVEENCDVISASGLLKVAFDDLRSEIFTFYQASDELSVDDLLLKELIVDQERVL